MAEPILSVRNLGTAYGDLKVVWDVSFEVWPGEVSVILGRNGAGKTSTLRAVTGLNKLSNGQISMDGQDISTLSAHARVRKGMSFVQEGKKIFRELTVEQNLQLGGYTTAHRRAALRRKVDEICETFPILAEKRHSRAASLSGGQQQMLAIGQALMAGPRLLILDEPSGGLAPVIVNEVMSRIEILRATGIGILLVEQAVEAALGVADHIAVLDLGKVLYSSTKEGIGDGAQLREAYFGRTAESA